MWKRASRRLPSFTAERLTSSAQSTLIRYDRPATRRTFSLRGLRAVACPELAEWV
jgi:hypothetical protein